MPIHSRPVFIHYHIFKNAGSSIDGALKEAFGNAWGSFEADSAKKILSADDLHKYLDINPELKAVSSHGARPPLPNDYCLPIVFLRHPILRVKSIYEFCRKDKTQFIHDKTLNGFREFIHWAVNDDKNGSVVIKNYQVIHLSEATFREKSILSAKATILDLEQAESLLLSFPVVGIVESYKESIQLINYCYRDYLKNDLTIHWLNKSSINKNTSSIEEQLDQIRIDLGDELYNTICKENTLDLKLYNSCVERFKEKCHQVLGSNKTHEMKFTGERYIPIEQGKIRLEHYHRYAIVQDIVTQKDVLDLACGEGYGSSFMANVAQSVVGVDISEEAVQHASTKYIKSNLNFQQGSATALNFADATFDVVVSFETIEHLAEQAEMLAEIRRVLRPNGLLIISSPNRPIYSEESGEHNEYHVKELDFNEFDQLLKAQFPAIQYFGQRMLMGSVIQDMAGGQNSLRAWHDNGHDLKPTTGHLVDPVYFLAVCGVVVSDLPKIDSSFIYPENVDLIKHYVGFAKWAKSLEQETEERNGLITKLQAELSERNAWGLAQDQDLKDRATIIEQLQAQVTERTEWAQALDKQLIERTEWALSLDKELVEKNQKI